MPGKKTRRAPSAGCSRPAQARAHTSPNRTPSGRRLRQAAGATGGLGRLRRRQRTMTSWKSDLALCSTVFTCGGAAWREPLHTTRWAGPKRAGAARQRAQRRAFSDIACPGHRLPTSEYQPFMMPSTPPSSATGRTRGRRRGVCSVSGARRRRAEAGGAPAAMAQDSAACVATPRVLHAPRRIRSRSALFADVAIDCHHCAARPSATP